MLYAGSPRSRKDFFLVCDPHCSSCHGMSSKEGEKDYFWKVPPSCPHTSPSRFLLGALEREIPSGCHSSKYVFILVNKYLRLIFPSEFTFLIKCGWSYSLL